MYKRGFFLMDTAGEGGAAGGAAAGAAGAEGDAGAAAAAAAAAGQPWYQGADPDIIGHLQNRGWDRREPKDVVLEAIKAQRAAEKMIGTPADQLIRFPKDAADEANWKALRTKLGVPEDASAYDFSEIKFADGTPLDEKFVEFMRNTAKSTHLPKDAATQITQEFAKFLEQASVSEEAETTAKLVEEKKALAANWGPNFDANKFVAQQGAKALGLGPEEISALEGVVGYAKVMEAMRKVGVMNKEDAYISGQGSTSGGVMTREQAHARMAELKADKSFATKLLAGDADANRQWKSLQVIIAGA